MIIGLEPPEEVKRAVAKWSKRIGSSDSPLVPVAKELMVIPFLTGALEGATREVVSEIEALSEDAARIDLVLPKGEISLGRNRKERAEGLAVPVSTLDEHETEAFQARLMGALSAISGSKRATPLALHTHTRNSGAGRPRSTYKGFPSIAPFRPSAWIILDEIRKTPKNPAGKRLLVREELPRRPRPPEINNPIQTRLHPAGGTLFSEDELVILLDHYLRRRDSGDADLDQLERRIISLPGNSARRERLEAFRTRDGLARAVRRFGAFEEPPTASIEDGRVAYRAVWEKYAEDPDALRARLQQVGESSDRSRKFPEVKEPPSESAGPPDAKAATSTRRIFGEIDGIPSGTVFPDRAALAQAGIHRPTQAGIAGGSKVGAESVVVSGGYEDDDDRGDTILYTGHGGKDPKTGKQVEDQILHRGNRALALSCDQGIPVRVVRGPNPDSDWAPSSGYRYDGLFSVDSYSRVRGRSGFFIWRFTLVRLEAGFLQPVADGASSGEDESPAPPVAYTSVQRRIRNTAVAQLVKELHDFTCQICGARIELETGAYAEGAHIRALGKPHNGPDVKSNILCLCPNDHVLFDKGVLVVDDDFVVRNRLEGSVLGKLRRDSAHSIDPSMLAYHRSLHE